MVDLRLTVLINPGKPFGLQLVGFVDFVEVCATTVATEMFLSDKGLTEPLVSGRESAHPTGDQK